MTNMITSKLTISTALLFFSYCSIGVLMTLPRVVGQQPQKDLAIKDAAGDASEMDKNKLQGHWQIMSLDMGGRVIKRADNLGIWYSTFEKDFFFKGDRTGQIGHSNSKYKLDATREPKQITIFHDDGKNIYRGIYKLEGDTLTICMNGDGTSICRPEEFVTKSGSPVMIQTLKKITTSK